MQGSKVSRHLIVYTYYLVHYMQKRNATCKFCWEMKEVDIIDSKMVSHTANQTLLPIKLLFLLKHVIFNTVSILSKYEN